MAGDPFKYTQDRSDKLIEYIIVNLTQLLSALKTEKENQLKERKRIIQELYIDKKEFIENKKAELENKAKEASHTHSPEQEKELKRIGELEEIFNGLIVAEFDIGSGEAKKMQDDPARIEREIGIVNSIIALINEKARNKNRRRSLTSQDVDAIEAQLKNIYEEVLTRQQELEIKEKYFDPLRNEIERQAAEIIGIITILLETIPGPATPGNPNPEIVDVPVPQDPDATAGTAPVDTNVISGDTTGEEAQDIVKDVADAVEVVDEQRGWFTRIWGPLTKLAGVAKSTLKPGDKLSQAKKWLKKVKWGERREQWKASAKKLGDKLNDIYKNKKISPKLKERFGAILSKLKIWEGKELVDTVQGIGEELDKKPEEVDWNKVSDAVKEVEKDDQAAEALDKELKDELSNLEEAAQNTITQNKNWAAAAGTTVKSTIGGWWGSLNKNAGNLISGITSKKRTVGGLLTNVKAFGGKNLKKANGAVKSLIRRARGIKDLPSSDVSESDKQIIESLADELEGRQEEISKEIGDLDKKKLSPKKIEEIALKIKDNSMKAVGFAQTLTGELNKVLGKVVGGAKGKAEGVKSKAAAVKGAAPQRVKAGVESGKKKIIGAGKTVAGAVGGKIPAWFKRNPNPIPTLQDWWGKAGVTAKKLKEKINKGEDASEEMVEAGAEAETTDEANQRFKALTNLIDGIKNFDPKGSAKLVGFVNNLSVYQTTITENLKKLKIPGLSKKDAQTAAKAVEAASLGAEGEINKVKAVLSKFPNLAEWLKGKAPNIDIRGKIASAKAAVGNIPRPDLGAIQARITTLNVTKPIKATLSAVASGKNVTQKGFTNLIELLTKSGVPTRLITNLTDSVKKGIAVSSETLNQILDKLQGLRKK